MSLADRLRKVELEVAIDNSFGNEACTRERTDTVADRLDCLLGYQQQSTAARTDSRDEDRRRAVGDALLPEARAASLGARDLGLAAIPALRTLENSGAFDTVAERFPDAVEQEEEFDLVDAATELFETETVIETFGTETVERLREQLESVDDALPTLSVADGDLVAVSDDGEQRFQLAEQERRSVTTQPSYRDQLSQVTESLDAAGGTFLAPVPARRLDDDEPLVLCGRRTALSAVVDLVKGAEREVRELEDTGLSRVAGEFIETAIIIVAALIVVSLVTMVVAGLLCSGGGNDTACDIARVAGFILFGSTLVFCTLTGFTGCVVTATVNTAGASMSMQNASVNGGFLGL